VSGYYEGRGGGRAPTSALNLAPNCFRSLPPSAAPAARPVAAPPRAACLGAAEVSALEPARRPSSDEPTHKHISRLRPAPPPPPLRRPHGAGRTPCVDASDEAALATSRAAALRPPPRPGRAPCAPLRLLPACTRNAPVSWPARGVSWTPFRPERAAAKPPGAAERLCAAGPCRPHLRRARARRRGRVSRTRAPSTCRFRGRPGRGARVGSPRLAARDAGAEGAREITCVTKSDACSGSANPRG